MVNPRTHKRVTGLYKSKLKAEPLIARSETGTKRGLKFSKDVLDKLDSYYSVPDEIEIVTHVTDVTGYADRQGVNNVNLDNEYTQNHSQITSDIIENNDIKDPLIPAKCVTTATSVTEEQVTDHSTKQTKDRLMSQTVTTVTSVTEGNGTCSNDTLHDSMVVDKRRTYTCRYCTHMTFNETDHWTRTVNRHKGKTGQPVIPKKDP